MWNSLSFVEKSENLKNKNINNFNLAIEFCKIFHFEKKTVKTLKKPLITDRWSVCWNCDLVE